MATEPERPSISGADPITILIADDSDTERLLLETILRNQGHRIISAVDGVEAVQAFKDNAPDIVLMDALMPRMDGYEAAAAIKAWAGEDFTPIIFLTALHDTDALVHCLEAGGDDFLTKPYNSIILQAKVKAFSRMRAMRQLLLRQRDQIAENNRRMIREQEVAKAVFDRVTHSGCLNADNIQATISPMAIFNGDIALAGVSPSGNFFLMLGDFTGHGLNAAIGAMPLAQTFYEMLEKGFLLRDILEGVNLKLFEVLPTDLFCCAIFVEINYREGILHVWNGGLPDCQLLRVATGECVALPSAHLPLGVRPEQQFDSRLQTYDVSPGDRLLLWTDGIFEIMDSKENIFGSNELESIVKLNSTSMELFSKINQAAASFKGEAAALDDISLIEITMVESWECQYQGPVFMEAEPGGGGGDWSLSYELRPDSLRNLNPLPQLLYILMETPSLRAHGGQIYTVLSELFTNALEHGLLGLDSSSKETEKGFGNYYLERDKRLADLQSGSIILSLDFQEGGNNARLVVNVEDSGQGFDFRPGLLGERQHNEYSGRGISLIEGLCDSIEYSGTGNTVQAVFSWRA